jgi:hypothetical protein
VGGGAPEVFRNVLRATFLRNKCFAVRYAASMSSFCFSKDKPIIISIWD